MEDKNIIEMAPEEEINEEGSTLKEGNYIVEVISNGNVIRKIAVANAEINISQLDNGGMTVDLK